MASQQLYSYLGRAGLWQRVSSKVTYSPWGCVFVSRGYSFQFLDSDDHQSCSFSFAARPLLELGDSCADC